MIEISFIVCPPIWPNLPPLGIAYLVSNIKNKNVRINVIDLNIELYNFLKAKNLFPQIYKNWTIGDYKASKRLLAKLENIKRYGFNIDNFILNSIKNSDIIGFSLFSSNLYSALYLAKLIKKNSYRSTKKQILIAGGPEVTLKMISNTIHQLYIFDHLFVGESESSINIFLDEYLKKYKQNFYIINESKIYTKNKIYNGFKIKKDINELIFPDYSKFNLNKYIRKKALPIFSSRGCIGQCKFCTERLLYKNIRVRNPFNIISEIEFFYTKLNIKWFTFYDSMVNANLNNFKKWMKLLLDKKIKIYWDAQMLIRKDMDDELFKLMKESGNINLFIGLESGSDSVLKKMGKFFTTKDAILFFEKLNKFNLFFEISLITGFPGETEEEFNQTLTFLEKYRHLIKKIAQINKFVLYDSLDKPYFCKLKLTKTDFKNRNIDNFTKKIILYRNDKIIEKRYLILKKHIQNLGYKYTEKYLGNLM